MQHKKSEKGINNIYWFATSCLSLQSRIQHTDSMIEAHFNNIRNLIINNIRTAQSEIKIAVAWFTQKELFEAIMNALERGVKVSLIMMKDFINCGIYGLPLQGFVDKGGNLHFVSNRGWTMHNKFCLFDNRVVISGSYNWTYSAETRNAENVISTDDEIVCSRFDDYFNRLWEESFAEETIPNVQISSEEVAQDFSFIQDELEAMERNEIIPSGTLNILKTAKTTVDVKIAQIEKPIFPPSVSQKNVTHALNIVSAPAEAIVSATKPGECVLLKTLSMPYDNGGEWVFAKQGTRLPCYRKHDNLHNSRSDGIEDCYIEKYIYEDNGWVSYPTYYNKEKILIIEDLPLLPEGEIHFKVLAAISKSGLLTFSVYCYNTRKTTKAELQLIEGEDFIIGK